MVVPCVSRKSVPTVPTTLHLLGLAINRNLHIYKYIPYIYLHTSYIFILYLVGGFNPSWKIWVRQLGRIIPYIMESKIDVWNHQAEYVNLPPLLYYFHRKCMSTPLGIARRWPLWHGCHQFPQNGAGTGQRAQGLQNRQKQHAKDMELGRYDMDIRWYKMIKTNMDITRRSFINHDIAWCQTTRNSERPGASPR